jgi:hypothetical protein
MIEAFQAVVPPVPEGEPRPLWSVMIPSYNCARFLEYTLESVLAQDPGPDEMQIEVIDDASVTDDPEAIVARVGAGRVVFHRQPYNVGHVRNFETCLARSRGRLIHLLHGDDAVRPGFYRTMERAFHLRPDIGAAFCRHRYIDERGTRLAFGRVVQSRGGVVDDWLHKIAVRQQLQTCAMVVRREVYEELGGFDRRIRAYGEDWEMWVRIASRYPVWYEPEPLAEYRLHGASLAARAYPTGQNARDLRQAMEIIRTHLAPEHSGSLMRRARNVSAVAVLRSARKAARRGDWATARVQVREGWRTSLAPGALGRVAWLVVRGVCRRGARKIRGALGSLPPVP